MGGAGPLARSIERRGHAHRHPGLSGWLFLFAVLMAAGLLFTMVFFVRMPVLLLLPRC